MSVSQFACKFTIRDGALFESSSSKYCHTPMTQQMLWRESLRQHRWATTSMKVQQATHFFNSRRHGPISLHVPYIFDSLYQCRPGQDVLTVSTKATMPKERQIFLGDDRRRLQAGRSPNSLYLHVFHFPHCNHKSAHTVFHQGMWSSGMTFP